MDDRGEWRLRPAITATIGLVAALLIQQLTQRAPLPGSPIDPDAWRRSAAMAVGVAAVLAMVTLERRGIGLAIGFAVALGSVAGLVTWWNGPSGAGDWFWDWRTACLFLGVAIAAPLFQTARDAGATRFDYADVHGHAWTNVILWCAACAFTAIAFALAFLLSELFQLIGIVVLRDLLRQDWAGAMLAGGAFGAAIGLLRERDRIVHTLQRVVTAILAVLAPVLGAGLLLFLAALPFTGLDALWDATRSTTPILLSCIIGALILANAVIGDGAGEEVANPVLRWSAMALGATMLPLAVIAAIAVGLRIGQHGLTPDRLWGLTFVVVASAYGLVYLVAIGRARQRWAAAVRPANLRLAFALMALALLLSTPLVSFNALSTRDQVARLTAGRVTPERFDWAALGFDFGPPGRAALARLTLSPDAAVAQRARDTARATNRWGVFEATQQARSRETIAARVRVLPAPAALPPALRDALGTGEACGRDASDRCTLLWRPGATEAFAVRDACLRELGAGSGKPVLERLADRDCPVVRLVARGGGWVAVDPRTAPDRDAATRTAIVAGLEAGAVEVRPVARRQLFVGGRPVGDAFE